MVAPVYKCEIHPDQMCVKMSDRKDRNPHAHYNDEESMTIQSAKQECDINHILRTLSPDEIALRIMQRAPHAQYGDFSNIPSYREAFDIVQRAERLFMELPWETRERFNNDPQKMVEFLNDSKNRDEAIKLGLVNPPKDKPADGPTPKAEGSDATPPKAKPAEGGA